MGPIKNLEKNSKRKQWFTRNDKCHCSNANINTFPSNIVYMYIVAIFLAYFANGSVAHWHYYWTLENLLQRTKHRSSAQ